MGVLQVVLVWLHAHSAPLTSSIHLTWRLLFHHRNTLLLFLLLLIVLSRSHLLLLGRYSGNGVDGRLVRHPHDIWEFLFQGRVPTPHLLDLVLQFLVLVIVTLFVFLPFFNRFLGFFFILLENLDFSFEGLELLFVLFRFLSQLFLQMFLFPHFCQDSLSHFFIFIQLFTESSIGNF